MKAGEIFITEVSDAVKHRLGVKVGIGVAVGLIGGTGTVFKPLSNIEANKSFKYHNLTYDQVKDIKDLMTDFAQRIAKKNNFTLKHDGKSFIALKVTKDEQVFWKLVYNAAQAYFDYGVKP